MILGKHGLGLVKFVVDEEPSRRLWKEEDEDEDETREQQLQPNDEEPLNISSVVISSTSSTARNNGPDEPGPKVRAK
jgi:hypothetical protein